MKRLILLSVLMAISLSFIGQPRLAESLISRLGVPAAESAGDLNRQDKVYRVPTRDKVVALSFDDGPDPLYTIPILEILKERGAKATFFVVGSQAEKYPEIVVEIDRQGHELANHTWSHPDMEKTANNQLMAEVQSTNLLIHKLTNKENGFFRPPRGKLGPGSGAELIRAGYTIVMWAICIENSKMNSPREMADRVLKNIAPGDIILLHDGLLDRSKTVQALPLLLDGLEQKGYRTATVGGLLNDSRSPAQKW